MILLIFIDIMEEEEEGQLGLKANIMPEIKMNRNNVTSDV